MVPKAQSPKPEGPDRATLVRNTQEVQLKLMKLYQKLGAAVQKYGESVTRIEQEGRNHESISEEIETRYQSIPTVELGEYGRDRDPEQVKALQLESARLHRDRASRELEAYAIIWKELQENYRIVVAEYLDYIRNNPDKIQGGMSPEDMLNGFNTELSILEFEASLIGLTKELCARAKELIRKTADWEKSYQEQSH